MMLIEFDSIYQTLLVMSAIVLSTIGVLVALLVTGRPFNIVMTGMDHFRRRRRPQQYCADRHL